MKKEKAPRIDWKARAQKAEPVAKAAAEFEYRYFMNYQTYTTREAAVMADNLKDNAFERLRLALRNTGSIKRD